MTTTTYHWCQDVRGALKNWNKGQWEQVAADNNTTAIRVKEQFRIMDFEGKRVIPISEPCEGFSYETGCPGHPVNDNPNAAGASAKSE